MVDISQAKEKIFAHNNVNPYVDITPYELKIGFPIVNYNCFFPHRGEVVIYAVPSATFKDKEQVAGYTGTSAGASVRVAKGVTVRTGRSGGQPIRNTVRKCNIGDLIVTNKRVVFIGKDDSFDFALDKITAIKPLSKETFIIQSGRNSKNIFVDSKAVIYAAGFVNYAITLHKDGIDINAEIQQAEDETTPELKALCDRVQQEVLLMKPVRAKAKKKRKGCIIQFLEGVLIFFVAILIGTIIYSISLGTNQGEDSQTSITSNETTEIVVPPLVDSIGKFSPSYATYEVGDVLTFTVYMRPHDLTVDDFVIENSDDSVISITNIALSSEGERTVLTFDVTSISVGKASIKIKGADGKTESNALNLTINEKDTSSKVYVTPTGEKYHFSATCAGSNATATTENKAKQSGKERCKKCG